MAPRAGGKESTPPFRLSSRRSRPIIACVDPSRPRLVEAGLFLLLLAVPVAIFPLATQPFSDLKLILLMLGTLALWASGLPLSRRLLLPVLAWIGFAVLAAAFGSDPLGSIIGPWEGTGLLLLLCCGALVLVLPSLTNAHVDRARLLLVASAAVLAAVPLVWAVTHSMLERMNLGVTLSASTIGNPVLLAIVLTAAIPAAVETRSRWWTIVLAVLLGAAFAADGERSALVLPLVATGLCLWLLPWSRRRTLVVAAVILAAGIGWALVEPGASGVRAAGRSSRRWPGSSSESPSCRPTCGRCCAGPSWAGVPGSRGTAS